MILHTIISGPRVEAMHIETLINCQQTPGRAAKVVTSAQKIPGASATLTKTRAPDGYGETTKVSIKINFDLDPNLNWGQNFNQQRYIEKIGTDLNQYARHLMSRDIFTFGNMAKNQINSLMDNRAAYSHGQERTRSDSTNSNNQPKPKLEIETKQIGIKINIPRNILHVLGHQKAHIIMNEIQEEIEMIANTRLENEVKREMAIKSSMANENQHLRNALTMANNRINQLSAEIHQMHLQNNMGANFQENNGFYYASGQRNDNSRMLQHENNIQIQ